jgi:spermidine synthase
VEPCPTVARLAKRFFDLSEDTEIIEDSGWDFVKSCQEKFDIIFIDMFDENGHLECLGDAKFYSDLHLIVAHSGLIIIDIAPADEDSLLAILLSIRPIFNHVQLSTEPEASNMILICSRAPFPGLAQTLILAEKLNNTLGINFSEALQKFSKLPAPVQYQ